MTILLVFKEARQIKLSVHKLNKLLWLQRLFLTDFAVQVDEDAKEFFDNSLFHILLAAELQAANKID